MSESAGLLLVAAAIYVWECVAVVRRGALALRGGTWGRFTLREALDPFGKGRWGFLLTSLLPLAGSTFLLSDWSAFRSEADLERRMDQRAMARRYVEVTKAVRAARILGTLLVAEIFLVLPTFMLLGRLRTTWLLLLGVLLVTHALLVVSYFASRRRFQSLEGATQEALTMLFSPLMSARAADLVQRRALLEFDPLAVACLLATPRSFAALARKILGHTEAHASSRSQASIYEQAAERFLRSAGIRRADLDRSPAPDDAHSRTFCPHCLTQFRLTSGHCPECQTPLRMLDPGSVETLDRISERVRDRQEKLLGKTRRGR